MIQQALSNPEYFELAGTEKISLDTVIEDVEALPPGLSRENKHFYLYMEEERPLAVLDLILHYPDDDAFYIGLFVLDGNRHGMGIGSGLYQALESEMRALGFRRARLGVLAQNEKGSGFWTKMGFAKVKTVISSIRPEKNWEVHVMEKILKPV